MRTRSRSLLAQLLAGTDPDELLNADLKQHVTKAAPARNKIALIRTAIGALRSIQKQPDRVETLLRTQRCLLCRSVATLQGRINSVVRHADGPLWRAARARLTFSRMSAALAVQMKGLGFSL